MKTINKSGQSIIEYVIVAVLVILGIIIMGPYVLRSVNAHFKLWDVGVQDSFEEKLTQGPVVNINVNCKCATIPEGCGANNANAQCAANQMAYTYQCDPVGCNGAPANLCQDDPSCCTKLSPLGCGTFPLPLNPDGTVNSSPGNAPQPPNNPTNCYYGQEILGNQCGSNKNIQCSSTGYSCPTPTCLGTLSPGATWCTGTENNLDQNYGLAYVTSCQPTPKCQVYCAGGYYLNSSKTACTNQFKVALALTSCANAPSGCTCSAVSVNNPDRTTTTTITDSCPITMCPTDATTTITSAAIVGDGCTDPNAIPGDLCTINFTYH